MLAWQHFSKCYTNFSENQLLGLYHALEPHIAEHRRRGKSPKLTWEDHLIVLLIL